MSESRRRWVTPRDLGQGVMISIEDNKIVLQAGSDLNAHLNGLELTPEQWREANRYVEQHK